MLKKPFVLVFLLAVVLCSCTGSESKTITLGTFNIEWLGDGVNDKITRTDEDYANIALVIKHTGADLLVLQEIENENALKKILQYLPEFGYHMAGTPGDQKLACIFRKNAGFGVDYIGDYSPLSFDTRLKPGMILHLRKGRKVIPLLAVHLKATSGRIYTDAENNEARSLRYRQAIAANRWADSVTKKAGQESIVIMGDFNDYIRTASDTNNTLLPLVSNKNLVFLTKGMKSCKYQNLNTIDHIVVSKDLAAKVKKHTLRMYDQNMALKDRQADKVSDHCPVLVNIEL